MNRQSVQGDANGARVSQFARDMEAFLEENTGLGVIALLSGEYAGGKQGPRAGHGTGRRSFQLKKFAQTVAAFTEMLTRVPELKQGSPQAQPPLRRPARSQPL